MSPSLATVINVVLDAAIVIAIVSLLVWGILANRRDGFRLGVAERRQGRDRRRAARPRPAGPERRRGDRRAPQSFGAWA